MLFSNGEITNAVLGKVVIVVLKRMRNSKDLQGRHVDDVIAILEERGDKPWKRMFLDDLKKKDKKRKGLSVYSDSFLCMGHATCETEKGQRLLQEKKERLDGGVSREDRQ